VRKPPEIENTPTVEQGNTAARRRLCSFAYSLKQQGYSYAKIAARLDVSEGTAVAMCYRAEESQARNLDLAGLRLAAVEYALHPKNFFVKPRPLNPDDLKHAMQEHESRREHLSLTHVENLILNKIAERGLITEQRMRKVIRSIVADAIAEHRSNTPHEHCQFDYRDKLKLDRIEDPTQNPPRWRGRGRG